jgi:hypothetical protein
LNLEGEAPRGGVGVGVRVRVRVGASARAKDRKKKTNQSLVISDELTLLSLALKM